ncbi:caspase-3-like [Eucyclogobius newberryi]|uniref:caspase-3-like n=1 Tax=Eucyclogobius newberryi TaxID=166745 RepID=UPI003B58E776
MAHSQQSGGDTVDAGTFSVTDDDLSNLKNSTDEDMFEEDEQQSSGDTVQSFTIQIKIKADKKQSSGFAVESAEIVGNKKKSIVIRKSEKQLEMKQSLVDSVDAGKITMGSPSSSMMASSSALNSEDQFVYKMDHAHVGHCLIINNETFTSGMAERKGTDLDAEALEKTFGDLGYEVTVHKDLTKKQMKEVLEKKSDEDHSKCASLVCVFLSHGNGEEIHGTDKPVRLENLTEYFKGDKCKSLLEKPKLFFIQACRGTNFDVGVGKDLVDSDPISQPTRLKIPVEADFLYAYATPPGHYAWRNHVNGSWFIQSLCEILPKHKDLELMQILTRVNRKVALDFESSNTNPRFNGKKAVPCITSMLTKDFYFPK